MPRRQDSGDGDRDQADGKAHRGGAERLGPVADDIAGHGQQGADGSGGEHEHAIIAARGDQDDGGIEHRDRALQRAQDVECEDAERDDHRRRDPQAGGQTPPLPVSAHHCLPPLPGPSRPDGLHAGREDARAQQFRSGLAPGNHRFPTHSSKQVPGLASSQAKWPPSRIAIIPTSWPPRPVPRAASFGSRPRPQSLTSSR